MTLRGFEAISACVTPDNRLGKKTSDGDAESGARPDGDGLPTSTDPDLARLVAAWPMLPEPIRRAVLALIDSVHPTPSD
jgi:hypothetical protein